MSGTKMPLLYRERLMTEVSNNKTHSCGCVRENKAAGQMKNASHQGAHLQEYTHTHTHKVAREKVRTLREIHRENACTVADKVSDKSREKRGSGQSHTRVTAPRQKHNLASPASPSF